MLKPAAAGVVALLVALTSACQSGTATHTNTGARPAGTPTSTSTAHIPHATAATTGTPAPNPGGLSDAQTVGALFMVYVYGSGAYNATPAQRAANIALYGAARWSAAGTPAASS
jgi:hypothetical protein